MFIFKNIMLGIFIFLTSPYATAGNFCLNFYSGYPGACVLFLNLLCVGAWWDRGRNIFSSYALSHSLFEFVYIPPLIMAVAAQRPIVMAAHI